MCAPSCRLCLHYASFKERQLVLWLCDNDAWPTNSPVQFKGIFKKEEIDHIWQQQRCNCKGTHVILFVFPGLLVICWYGHTNTCYLTELAVVKAQELKWIQTQKSLSWLVHQFAFLESLSWCHELSRKRTIWRIKAICFFWDIHKIYVLKYRTSYIDWH